MTGVRDMALIIAGTVLGTAVLVLDLGNRVFGPYSRTGGGFLWRLGLVLGAAALLASPLCFLAMSPASPAWRALAILSSAVGVLLFINFLFPYRWGIRRANSDAVRSSSTRPLAKGVVLREEVLEIPSWPAEVPRLSLLILADLHCNSRTKLRLLQQCLSRLQGQAFDAVLFLGDLGERKALLPEAVQALASVTSRFGTFCVRGNHDLERWRERLIKELLDLNGVVVLANASCRIAGGAVTLVGLETPWRKAVLAPCDPDDFSIALSHTPDNIALMERLNVHLGIAGHTHGGRLRMPVVGSLAVPTIYGRFLDRGLFRRGKTFLFVAPAVGRFPGVFGPPSEIVRLILTGPEGGGSADAAGAPRG
jgi:predicted MPP superfamily phosphohydrolase